jgi:alkaline phosphatase D
LQISRRALLRYAASAALASISQPSLADWAGQDGSGKLTGYPFTLGVASGEPWPDSVVLWTKLAPDPMEPRKLGNKALPVTWEIYADDKLTSRVNSGTAMARPELGHAVHVEVGGLMPGRPYWYRFLYDKAESEVGRTRTAPAAGSKVDRLNFAFCSCAEFEEAGFHAYAGMAKEDVDFIVHLGDYIYETTYGRECKTGAPTEKEIADKVAKKARCLRMRGKVLTLDDYRIRYAEARSDPGLRAAHARAPWIVTWDDHEVENDYAGFLSENNWQRSPEQIREFTRLRAAAYQAYYENLPLRALSRPNANGSLQLYRRFDFGDLVRLYMLDERQYRSQQACRRQQQEHQLAKFDGVWREKSFRPELCPEYADAGRTMLGQAQERWLEQSVAGSKTLWNVFAQGVMVADLDQRDHNAVRAPYQRFVHNDSWSGYPVAQQRLLDLLARPGTSNPIVLGGDIHAFFANQLYADGPAAQRLAGPEFVTSAISSWMGRNADVGPVGASPRNAHTVRYANLGLWHGYGLCTVSRDEARVVYRGWPHHEGVLVKEPIPDPKDLATFSVTSGSKKLKVESFDAASCDKATCTGRLG